jgi:uncharacterized membrane protein
MNKTFSAGWAIATLALTAYFSIAILLTGEVSLAITVLLLVLVIWLLTYKLKFRRLRNLELIMRMYTDFRGTLERIRERVAEDEARRRAAVDRERQILMQRESRRADRPKESSTADKKYTEMIERRVRESRANQDKREGTNEAES